MNIRDLARLCGVSPTAASLALRNSPRISAYLRTKIVQTAKQSGYKIDPKIAEVMANIARPKGRTRGDTLALVTAWPHRFEWQNNWLLNQFYIGLERRAEALGYRLENCWLGEPGMRSERMRGIIQSRGIEGVVIFNYTRAPAELDFDVEPFSTVVIGRALETPAIPSVDHDHYQGFNLCLTKLKKIGYRRLGFFIENPGYECERTLHQWEAAYRQHQEEISSNERMPIFYTHEAVDPSKLRNWISKCRPDAVIGVSATSMLHLKSLGLKIPEDIGFASLMWRNASDGCAGIDLEGESIGEAAADLVVQRLKSGVKGVARPRFSWLLHGVWREGSSIRLMRKPNRKRRLGCLVDTRATMS